MIILLDNVSIDTDGAAFIVPHGSDPISNHVFAFFVWGTLGGGNVIVQVSPNDGDDWFTARTANDNQLIFSVADMINAMLRAPLVRGRLTGSSGASGVYCAMY